MVFLSIQYLIPKVQKVLLKVGFLAWAAAAINPAYSALAVKI